MITIKSIMDIKYDDYDEVWAIVRSMKNINPHIKHVPELSPSWGLFRKYLAWRKEGLWDKDTFQNLYVPEFLKEMRGKTQQRLLTELWATKKHICLICFCPEEELCHRSIIGGMLQGAGMQVDGLLKDYSYYYVQWKDGAKRENKSAVTSADITSEKRLLLYNNPTELIDLVNQIGPVLAFTGRRPKDLCGWEAVQYKDFVSNLTDVLYEKFYKEKGIRAFVSGGAQGFDQMAFWAVQKMKKKYTVNDISNIVVIPFKGQDTRWAKTGCFSRQEYAQMLSQADYVAIVSSNNMIDAFGERNHQMCDCADHVLALYPDDSWTNAPGGTAECIRYAREKSVFMWQMQYTIDDAGLHMGDLFTLEKFHI